MGKKRQDNQCRQKIFCLRWSYCLFQTCLFSIKNSPLFQLFGSSDINLLKYPIKMENKAKCKGVIISCTLVKTKCFQFLSDIRNNVGDQLLPPYSPNNIKQMLYQVHHGFEIQTVMFLSIFCIEKKKLQRKNHRYFSCAFR